MSGVIANLKMTEEEAAALYNEHAKNLKLTFSSYYKFCFSFKGETDEIKVGASKGGNSEDIRKLEVTPFPIDAPATFEQLVGEFNSATITNKLTGAECDISEGW